MSVVIQDRDIGGAIIGILEVVGHDFDEICDTIDEIKSNTEDWTLDDILEGLENLGWDITFQEGVCSYSL